jgi:hypothetical protein
MRKAIKYVLIILIMFLFILGFIEAICWLTNTSVALIEVIKAILIARGSCFILVLGVTCIVVLLKSIMKE